MKAKCTVSLIVALAIALRVSSASPSDRPQAIRIAKDGKGFALEPSGRPFIPWGFNYDHDETGRLLEDYWQAEWPKVEEDFGEMKALGANVVRVHLQLGKFMESEERANAQSLRRLGRLLTLAERLGLYLDLTGLGCYHKPDVPAWYDALPEERRWAVQARFWEAVARQCKESPAVFCYDLMNEPVVPAGGAKRDDWLGGAFAGSYFVQCIALETKGRPRPEIARAWIRQLVEAIRREDEQRLVTVGLVPWSLDRPGKLYSGFAPAEIAPELDFICVHIYPERSKVPEALDTLSGFAVGKPVVIEEMFPLSCSIQELDEFVSKSKPTASGWIGFYWGRTLEECRASKELRDALIGGWLEYFQRGAP
jgi:hypothetical protein